MTDLDNAIIAAMGIPCTLPDDWSSEPVGTCGESAIALVHSACIHEHYDTPNVCAGCAAEIQRCAGILTCPRREEGRYKTRHECLPRVTIAWFDGSPVTVVQEARP